MCCVLATLCHMMRVGVWRHCSSCSMSSLSHNHCTLQRCHHQQGPLWTIIAVQWQLQKTIKKYLWYFSGHFQWVADSKQQAHCSYANQTACPFRIAVSKKHAPWCTWVKVCWYGLHWCRHWGPVLCNVLFSSARGRRPGDQLPGADTGNYYGCDAGYRPLSTGEMVFLWPLLWLLTIVCLLL